MGAVWQVAAAGGWVSPEHPGAWLPVARHFRDGHRPTWWALEGRAGPDGPDHPQRLIIATADPATLPGAATWFVATTLTVTEADLTEVVRLDGLRTWVEQQDQQGKGSLGWSHDQVRSDGAMRRHWALVQDAFAFCWWAESRSGEPPRPDRTPTPEPHAAGSPGERGGKRRRFRIRPGPGPGAAGRWRCWPVALRRVRAWREPAWFLWRCWRAWSDQPPPPPLHARLDWLSQGRLLCLYDSS